MIDKKMLDKVKALPPVLDKLAREAPGMSQFPQLAGLPDDKDQAYTVLTQWADASVPVVAWATRVHGLLKELPFLDAHSADVLSTLAVEYERMVDTAQTLLDAAQAELGTAVNDLKINVQKMQASVTPDTFAKLCQALLGA